ncbi:hypothetical protein BH11MYX2_BH11MYX2_31310 [soil metagenome]
MYTGLATGHINAEGGNRAINGKVELADTLKALLTK